MDGGAWEAAVHGVAKSQTRLTDSTFTFDFHALEKEMATHSSILAWKIPWMEDPGRLHPWGHKESETTEQLILSLSHYFYQLSLGQSGEGNGTPLQNSCLENPMDGGSW